MLNHLFSYTYYKGGVAPCPFTVVPGVLEGGDEVDVSLTSSRAKARGFLQAAYAAIRLPLAALGVPAEDSKRLTHRWRFHRRASGFRGVASAPCPFEEPQSSMFKAALASACQT